MSTSLKHTIAVLIILSLLLSSCGTTYYYSTKQFVVPNSRNMTDSYYNCKIYAEPTPEDPRLTVSFEKIALYEQKVQRQEFEEADNSETRMAGWCTILMGGLIGALVAAGGTDDDGNPIEPNPGAGKTIFFGGLIIGGLMAIIGDTKTEVSSHITSSEGKERIPLDDQDSTYTIWSSIYPENVISKTLINDEISLDVTSDLGLDYIENQDSVTVFFQSNLDEKVVYQVGIQASDYLTRYLQVNTISDSIALYQAPTTNAPIVGYVKRQDDLVFRDLSDNWYHAIWKFRKVYLREESIGYFYARE